MKQHMLDAYLRDTQTEGLINKKTGGTNITWSELQNNYGPELKLVTAILTQAVMDYKSKSTSPKHEAERADAKEFLDRMNISAQKIEVIYDSLRGTGR